MIKYRSFSLFWLLCLFIFVAGCDNNGSGDSEDTFRFFDELDFFDDPSLRHDPENGIHLTFLEPPEAVLLPTPNLQVAMTDPEESGIVWAQLDAPGADIGVDYHIYDVGLQGLYRMSFVATDLEAARSSQNLIVAIADMTTGEVVAGARYLDGVPPVFDLVQGSYIALVTSEDYLDDKLGSIEAKEESLEETCGSNPVACASYMLENTVAISWSMDDQAAFINDNSNGVGNVLQMESAGVMDVAEEDLPAVLQARAETYRNSFITAFNLPGGPLPEVKIISLEPGPEQQFDLENPPGLDMPTCASGAAPICPDEPFPVCLDDSDPLCSAGTAVCTDNVPSCSADIPVISVGFDKADEGADLNDGLDQFSDDEMEVINTNVSNIVGGF